MNLRVDHKAIAIGLLNLLIEKNDQSRLAPLALGMLPADLMENAKGLVNDRIKSLVGEQLGLADWEQTKRALRALDVSEKLLGAPGRNLTALQETIDDCTAYSMREIATEIIKEATNRGICRV